MAYGIIRVQKVKRAAVGAMQYHNDRVPGEHSNEDIDPERTAYNKEYVKHGSYRAEVAERIERGRTSDRKVRKDAVVLCEGIATASPEFFEGKTYDGVMAYFDDVYEFVKKEAGEGNLIHFTVHMDETTPHAHFGFTPIKDGSLAWKKFFDGKYALRAFQDRHWEQVGKKWGLERGEKSEDTGRTHKETAQMKRDAARELHQVERQVEQGRDALGEVERQVAQTSERLEGLQQREVQLGEEIEELQPVAVTLPESVRIPVSSRGDGSRLQDADAEKAELGAAVGELEQQVEAARARVEQLERDLPGLRDRVRELGARLDHARVAVRDAIAKLAEVPRGLSEAAREMARALGKRIAGERPNPTMMAAEASRVAAGVSLRGETAAMKDASRQLERGNHARGGGRGAR